MYINAYFWQYIDTYVKGKLILAYVNLYEFPQLSKIRHCAMFMVIHLFAD